MTKKIFTEKEIRNNIRQFDTTGSSFLILALVSAGKYWDPALLPVSSAGCKEDWVDFSTGILRDLCMFGASGKVLDCKCVH